MFMCANTCILKIYIKYVLKPAMLTYSICISQPLIIYYTYTPSP